MLIDRNVTGKMLVMLVIEKATVVRAMVKRDRAAVIKHFVTLQSVQGEDDFAVVEITMEVMPVFGLKMTALVGKDWNNCLREKPDSLGTAVSFSHMNRTYIYQALQEQQNFFLRSGLLFALGQFSKSIND